MTRRQTTSFLAILALMLQLVGTGWAINVALAADAFEVELATTICTHADADSGEAEKPAPHQHAVCPICLAASNLASPALLPGVAAIAVPYESSRIVHAGWQAAAPRGPPLLGPKARAPPLSF